MTVEMINKGEAPCKAHFDKIVLSWDFFRIIQEADVISLSLVYHTYMCHSCFHASEIEC